MKASISGASPDNYLSRREIARRLRQVLKDTDHLKNKLPPDNPHNQLLKFTDICRYVDFRVSSWIRWAIKEEPHKNCRFSCSSLDFCRANPHCKPLDEKLLRKLSDFFKDWDAGLLVKARVNGKWGIYRKGTSPVCHTPLAQMAAETIPEAHTRPQIEMRIDLTTLGLKIK